MRILQLNNYADPVGGAEVYALALARELKERGHTVAFFGTSPDHESREEEWRVVRRPRYDAALLYRDPSVRAALAEQIARFRPEIVHVHNVFSLGLDVLSHLGSTGLPIVQTVHDFSLLCPNSWCVRGDGSPCSGGAGAQCFQHGCQKNYPYDPEVALHTALKQQILNAIVDLMVCPSRYLADLMSRNGARDVRHLNYFIDPIANGEPVRRQEKELVFIGRLEPEKGVEHLLDAMREIRAVDPEVHLTIVGGGSLSDGLAARAADSGLGAAVTFLSHVPRAELGRFYATATACVLPSIWSENSPLVAYECLTAGLPMIASRIGGIPELVEEGVAGFTFEARDARDLAAKALRLLGLSPGERERMSEAMRARAREFRAPAHVDRIARLYDEVRGRARTPTEPALAIDHDLLFLLAEYGAEKARLGTYFREHVLHIRHLEAKLAGESASSPEGHTPTNGSRDGAGQENPAELVRRLARALNLPSVFRR